MNIIMVWRTDHKYVYTSPEGVKAEYRKQFAEIF